MMEQEIIIISSDLEKEILAVKKNDKEQKSEKELWKFRNPKRSCKYNPDETDDTANKANEEWLSKRYPTYFQTKAVAFKSFRKNTTSKDTCFF